MAPVVFASWLLLCGFAAEVQEDFSGSGGITGPGGLPAADPSTFRPDLRKHDDRVLFNFTLRL